MKKLCASMLSVSLLSGLLVSPATSHAESSSQETVEVLENTDGTEMEIVTEVEEGNAAESEGTLEQTTFVHNEDSSLITETPVSPVIPKDGPSKVIVGGGGTYSWDYVNTTYGNNVAYNTINNYALKAVTGGLSAVIVKRLPGTFLKGAAGSVAGTATLKIKPGVNSWWTVKKYTDYDAVNTYIKLDVKIYSNSSRTKLVTAYSQIHKHTKY